MCIPQSVPDIKAAPQIIAAPRSTEGVRAGDIETRLRRMRSSAASRILTSPQGIPSGVSETLGGAA